MHKSEDDKEMKITKTAPKQPSEQQEHEIGHTTNTGSKVMSSGNHDDLDIVETPKNTYPTLEESQSSKGEKTIPPNSPMQPTHHVIPLQFAIPTQIQITEQQFQDMLRSNSQTVSSQDLNNVNTEISRLKNELMGQLASKFDDLAKTIKDTLDSTHDKLQNSLQKNISTEETKKLLISGLQETIKCEMKGIEKFSTETGSSTLFEMNKLFQKQKDCLKNDFYDSIFNQSIKNQQILMDQLEKSEKKLSEKIHVNHQMMEKLMNLTTKYEDSTSKFAKLSQDYNLKLAAKDEKLAAKDDLILTLTSKCDLATSKKLSLENQVNDLGIKNAELEKQLSIQEKKIVSLEQEKVVWKTEKSKLDKDLDNFKRFNTEIVRDLDSKSEKCVQLEEMVENLTKNLNQKKVSLSESEESYEKLNLDLKEMNLVLEQLDRQLRERDDMFRILEEEYARHMKQADQNRASMLKSVVEMCNNVGQQIVASEYEMSTKCRDISQGTILGLGNEQILELGKKQLIVYSEIMDVLMQGLPIKDDKFENLKTSDKTWLSRTLGYKIPIQFQIYSEDAIVMEKYMNSMKNVILNLFDPSIFSVTEQTCSLCLYVKFVENRDIEKWKDEFYDLIKKIPKYQNKKFIGIILKSKNVGGGQYNIRPLVSQIGFLEKANPTIESLFTLSYDHEKVDPNESFSKERLKEIRELMLIYTKEIMSNPTLYSEKMY